MLRSAMEEKSKEGGVGGSVGFNGMVRKGLSDFDQMAFEQTWLSERATWLHGKSIWAEKTAGAKAVKRKHAWLGLPG